MTLLQLGANARVKEQVNPNSRENQNCETCNASDRYMELLLKTHRVVSSPNMTRRVMT